jgi:hypothetical protein
VTELAAGMSEILVSAEKRESGSQEARKKKKETERILATVEDTDETRMEESEEAEEENLNPCLIRVNLWLVVFFMARFLFCRRIR